jgi:hypothetical protein
MASGTHPDAFARLRIPRPWCASRLVAFFAGEFGENILQLRIELGRGYQKPPGDRLLQVFLDENIPGGHPQHLRQRRGRLSPVPHQGL